MSASVLPPLRLAAACSGCAEAGSGLSLFAAAPEPGCWRRCCLPGGAPPAASTAAAAAAAPAELSAALAALLVWRLCARLPPAGGAKVTTGTRQPARSTSGFLSAAIRRRRSEDREVNVVASGAEMLGHNVLLEGGEVIACEGAD